jgi:hypothetical protein
VNSAAINMCVQVSLLYVDLNSFKYIKTGMAGYKVGLFLVL